MLQRSVDEAINALDLILLGHHRDVVLDGVGNPVALVAGVRDALVVIPVILVWQGLVQAVVEVLVVGEDDMATNIVELNCRRLVV